MPLLVVEVFQSANCLLRNYFWLISSSVIWAEEWLHYWINFLCRRRLSKEVVCNVQTVTIDWVELKRATAKKDICCKLNNLLLASGVCILFVFLFKGNNVWDLLLRVHDTMTVFPISSYFSKDSSVLIVMWFFCICFNLFPIQLNCSQEFYSG